jgi:hypothetical protein
MARAFAVQENELQDGLGQVSILRGEREAAEAEVARLTAQLAAADTVGLYKLHSVAP